MWKFILICYLVVSIYTPIHRMGFGGVYFLDGVFLVSFIYVFYKLAYLFVHYKKIPSYLKLERHGINSLKYLVVFCFIGFMYVFLSYLNLFEFVFKNINFKIVRFYIPRQSYFLFYFVIGLALHISLSQSFQKLNVIIKHIPILILFLLVSIFITDTSNTRIYSVLLPVLILILSKTKNTLFQNVLYYVSLIGLVLSLKIGGFTNKICLIFSLLYIFLNEKLVISFINKHRMKLIFSMILCLIFIFMNLNSIKKIDVNSWFRAVLWYNNIQTVQKTNFIGVGFGTPYVTTNVFDYLNQFNDKDGMSGIYIMPQHNSLLNVLYRMGILGLTFFVLFNINILTESYINFKSLSEKKMEEDKIIILALFLGFILSLFNIFFNVGLESPRVFISNLIFTSLLINFNFSVRKNIAY